MRLIGETAGTMGNGYYYMVERTYELEDGSKVHGFGGFDSGAVGGPEFAAAVERAKLDAEADAREQINVRGKP
jgi:hypothetical protein